MSGLAFFAFLAACFVAANICTVIVSTFRSIKAHDTFFSWRWTLGFFAIIAAAPYLWDFNLTRTYGREFGKPVDAALDEAGVDGHLCYYRVKSYSPTAAELLIVANEVSGIGFKEHLIMTCKFVKEKKGWELDKYDIVSSFKRNRDSVTFPPYW